MPRRALFIGLVLVLALLVTPTAFAQEEEPGVSAFCGNANAQAPQHPLALGIADRYGATYEEVMGWYCAGEGLEGVPESEDAGGHYGFGEIILALQTNKVTGRPTDEVLANQRGNGWGRVWKDLGLIGKPEDADPPGWANRPDHAGQGQGQGPQNQNQASQGQGRGQGQGQGGPDDDCLSAADGQGQGQGQGRGQGQGGPPDCPEVPETETTEESSS